MKQLVFIGVTVLVLAFIINPGWALVDMFGGGSGFSNEMPVTGGPLPARNKVDRIVSGVKPAPKPVEWEDTIYDLEQEDFDIPEALEMPSGENPELERYRPQSVPSAIGSEQF